MSAGPDGPGRAVVFVHGQPGLGSDWDPVAQRLGADHRVLAPDRPGYGHSGRPPMSMDDNAELLVRALIDQDAAPATVVGHSYGGGIAILAAARHPDVVAGLVLVSSVGRKGSVGTFDHLLAWPGVGDALSAASLFTLNLVLPRLQHLRDRRTPDSWAWLEAVLPDKGYGPTLWSAQVWRTFVAEQRSLLREIEDVEGALAQVTAPCVVITGTRDVVVPPSVAVRIATDVAGAELVIVAQAGHFVQRQHPTVVADAVRRVEQRAARRC